MPCINYHRAMTTEKAVRQAVERAGGSVAVAAALGMKSQQAVLYWVKQGKVPAERVIPLEKLSGVSRHDLRPDLYPRD